MAARRLGALAALALAACGGGAEGPPDDPNIPLDTLCQELAAADCARLSTCGALYPPMDAAGCNARQAIVVCAPMQVAFQAAQAAQTLDYFELAARDCRDAVGKLSCDIGPDHDPLDLPECRAMVAGTGTEGDPCHLGLACADGFVCDVGAACPGRCLPLIGNNQPCTAADHCAAELYCDLMAMRCLPRAPLGAACALSLSGSSCADGAFCDRINPGNPTCTAARGRNQGCTQDAECAGGASCIRNRCSAGLDGDACLSSVDCAPGLACGNNGCRAPQGPDEACAPGGTPCLPGLTCTTTTAGDRCVAQLAAGVPCRPDGPECFLGACHDGVCRRGQADGGACGVAEECLPGRTCEGGRCTVIPADCRP